MRIVVIWVRDIEISFQMRLSHLITSGVQGLHLPASATLKLEWYQTRLDPSHSSCVTGTQKDNKRTATPELLWDSRGECTLANTLATQEKCSEWAT